MSHRGSGWEFGHVGSWAASSELAEQVLSEFASAERDREAAPLEQAVDMILCRSQVKILVSVRGARGFVDGMEAK